jgi:3-phenylpropionate/trans-cinnamate dioxygenase ferredoxin reductase component
MNGADVVIIGAGHSGGMAAIMLRKSKFKGSITIIGDENYPPYQKPPLSKRFLSEKVVKERLFLKKITFFNQNKIDLLLNNSVSKIDRKKQIIILNNNNIVCYKKLIIATGSNALKLNLPSKNNDTLYLRSIEDAEKIKEFMSMSRSIGIIGSGYIGLEVAAIAAKKGLDVCVIERESRLMSRVVCKEISDFYQQKHEKEGVKFILNCSVIDIEKKQDCHVIKFQDNNLIKTEMIVVGIGIKPNIQLAVDAGIQCSNGIFVNKNCLTSDENIFAIGDCTIHPNSIYGDLRLESVHNAVEQAKTAASFIIGEPKPYEQVPWFWSEQYNIKLQIAGISHEHDEILIKGSLENEKFTVFYLKNNTLIALDAVNSPKEFTIGKKLIEYRTNKSSQSFKDLIKK